MAGEDFDDFDDLGLGVGSGAKDGDLVESKTATKHVDLMDQPDVPFHPDWAGVAEKSIGKAIDAATNIAGMYAPAKPAGGGAAPTPQPVIMPSIPVPGLTSLPQNPAAAAVPQPGPQPAQPQVIVLQPAQPQGQAPAGGAAPSKFPTGLVVGGAAAALGLVIVVVAVASSSSRAPEEHHTGRGRGG